MPNTEKLQQINEGYRPQNTNKGQVPSGMEKQGGYQPPKEPKTVAPPPKKL